jgi:hypothetical protein
VAKTWHQKLEGSHPAHVEVLDKPFGGMPIGARMLIPTPMIVKETVERLKPGESRTVAQLREDLARQFEAEVTCPLTTGIFLRIVAEAALVDLANGKHLGSITPFWRVIDPKSPLAKKLSCGTEFLQERRTAEKIA